MSNPLLTDDAVIKLLQEDARSASSRASRRPGAQAPKTNIRFLRNILKETTGHNQALLAKEAEEAQARLRELKRREDRARRDTEYERLRERRDREDEDEHHRVKRQRMDLVAQDTNRLSPPVESYRHTDDVRPRRKRSRSREEKRERSRSRSRDLHRKRRRRDHSDTEEDHARHKRRSRRDRSQDEQSVDGERRHRQRHKKSHRHTRDRSPSVGKSERKEGRICTERDRPDNRKRSRRSPSSSGSGTDQPHRDSFRQRSHRSPSTTPTRSTSYADTQRRPQYGPDLPRKIASARKRQHPVSPPRSSSRTNGLHRHDGADSDPLEEIVGPLPPAPTPPVRIRGRGAVASSAGMDSRFSSGYDPSQDVALDAEDDDDWGQALEALQARAKFKQSQGDRLRAAGFTDEEIKSWEKGGEKGEEDVTWAKRGEGREWDRGKVLDDEGKVVNDVDFGRLK